MAVVLFGWELGGGLGHVARLLNLARPLAAAGHQPVFVVRDLERSTTILKGTGYTVMKAPSLPARPNVGATFVASSYADILAAVGFDNPPALLALTSAWDDVIARFEPQLIIADHAPALCLSAYRTLPVVAVGNGFACPPLGSDEFPLLPDIVAKSSSQQPLLEAIRFVQQRRNRPLPDKLTDFLKTDARFILIWPDFDPYHAVRGEETLLGPLDSTPHRSVPTFPAHPQFFAYLTAGFPGVDRILSALVSAGLRGEAYVRGLSAGDQSRIRCHDLLVHAHPVPIGEAVARSSVVLHHASLGVVHAAAAAARPQVGLPRHIEQQLTGNAIHRLGVGRSLRGTIRISDIVNAVQQVNEASIRQSAIDLAERLYAERSANVLDEVLGGCLKLLE